MHTDTRVVTRTTMSHAFEGALLGVLSSGREVPEVAHVVAGAIDKGTVKRRPWTATKRDKTAKGGRR